MLYGIHNVELEGLAGNTLAQARGLLEATLDVTPDTPALSDGKPIKEDHVISGDETLEFLAEAGKKG